MVQPIPYGSNHLLSFGSFWMFLVGFGVIAIPSDTHFATPTHISRPIYYRPRHRDVRVPVAGGASDDAHGDDFVVVTQRDHFELKAP